MSRAAINSSALLGLLAAACVLTASPASAALIASQAPIDGGDSYESTIGFGLQNGDTFVVNQSGSVTGLEWWGTQLADTSGFYVRLFDSQLANAMPVYECDDGTSSANVCDPIAASATSLMDSFGSPIDKFSIDFSAPIGLSAGTYLLSIGYDVDYWYWLAGSGSDGVGNFRAADDESWSSAPPAFSFSVIGTLDTGGSVPEPGTLALLGVVGLAGVVRRTRQRRKA